MDNIREIKQIGFYYKKMELCGHSEKLHKLGNYFITLENNIVINAVGSIDSDGFYFNIISIRDGDKNRKYNSCRFFRKYILLVRNALYNYITKEAAN